VDRGGIRADGEWPRRCRIIAACASRARSSDSCSTTGWHCAAMIGAGRRRANGGKTLIETICRPTNVRVGTFETGWLSMVDCRGVLQATTAGWRVDVDGPGAAGTGFDSESSSAARSGCATRRWSG
jgi:hypothetical protein